MRKWNRVPRGYEAGEVVVTIPEDDAETDDTAPEVTGGGHEAVQNRLLQMGAAGDRPARVRPSADAALGDVPVHLVLESRGGGGQVC